MKLQGKSEATPNQANQEAPLGVVMVIQKTNPNLYGNFSPTSAHIQKHCLHMHFYPNQPPELPCPG